MASGGSVNSSTTGLILEHFLLLSGNISHIKAILDVIQVQRLACLAEEKYPLHIEVK